jgi:hypothetical protein
VLAGWLVTQVFVLVAWVLFRADSFGTAWVMLGAMAGRGAGSGAITLRDGVIIGGIGLGLVLASLLGRSGWRPNVALPAGWQRPVLTGIGAACVILFASLIAPNGSETFIYFQF